MLVLLMTATGLAQTVEDGVDVEGATMPASSLTFEAPGAPEGCSSSYVLQLSHPMMEPEIGMPFSMEAWEVTEGPEWAACRRMVSPDVDGGVFIMLVWDPQWRGDMQCGRDGELSPTVRITAPETSYSNEVKVRWNAAPKVPRGQVPNGVGPCAAGEPPGPRTAATPGRLTDPVILDLQQEFMGPQPQWETAFAAVGGSSRTLGGFAYAGRLGVGRHSGRLWLGPALEFNTWQAVPWVGEGVFSAFSLTPQAWAAYDVLPSGFLRLHGVAGAGIAQYRQDDDGLRAGEVSAKTSPVAMGAVGGSIAFVMGQLAYYGPGVVLCEPGVCTDMRHDLQWTVGLTFRI